MSHEHIPGESAADYMQRIIRSHFSRRRARTNQVLPMIANLKASKLIKLLEGDRTTVEYDVALSVAIERLIDYENGKPWTP